HLAKLRDFLLGIDLETRQSRLWPYNFDVIPIEFISSIYEEFFHADRKNQEEAKGTHYTPPNMVRFLLDQVLPVSTYDKHPTILDPSCGSGIFLVEAFRRIIAFHNLIPNSRLKVRDLQRILRNYIFGVDKNKEAVRVAAFSLYLTMLDYLEPKSIWQEGHIFPQLI